MTHSVSFYLNELKLYADSTLPAVRSWYGNCQRPGEFKKRLIAILPSTPTHCVAMLVFPTKAYPSMQTK